MRKKQLEGKNTQQVYLCRDCRSDFCGILDTGFVSGNSIISLNNPDLISDKPKKDRKSVSKKNRRSSPQIIGNNDDVEDSYQQQTRMSSRKNSFHNNMHNNFEDSPSDSNRDSRFNSRQDSRVSSRQDSRRDSRQDSRRDTEEDKLLNLRQSSRRTSKQDNRLDPNQNGRRTSKQDNRLDPNKDSRRTSNQDNRLDPNKDSRRTSNQDNRLDPNKDSRRTSKQDNRLDPHKDSGRTSNQDNRVNQSRDAGGTSFHDNRFSSQQDSHRTSNQDSRRNSYQVSNFDDNPDQSPHKISRQRSPFRQPSQPNVQHNNRPDSRRNDPSDSEEMTDSVNPTLTAPNESRNSMIKFSGGIKNKKNVDQANQNTKKSKYGPIGLKDNPHALANIVCKPKCPPDDCGKSFQKFPIDPCSKPLQKCLADSNCKPPNFPPDLCKKTPTNVPPPRNTGLPNPSSIPRQNSTPNSGRNSVQDCIDTSDKCVQNTLTQQVEKSVQNNVVTIDTSAQFSCPKTISKCEKACQNIKEFCNMGTQSVERLEEPKPPTDYSYKVSDTLSSEGGTETNRNYTASPQDTALTEPTTMLNSTLDLETSKTAKNVKKTPSKTLKERISDQRSAKSIAKITVQSAVDSTGQAVPKSIIKNPRSTASPMASIAEQKTKSYYRMKSNVVTDCRPNYMKPKKVRKECARKCCPVANETCTKGKSIGKDGSMWGLPSNCSNSNMISCLEPKKKDHSCCPQYNPEEVRKRKLGLYRTPHKDMPVVLVLFVGLASLLYLLYTIDILTLPRCQQSWFMGKVRGPASFGFFHFLHTLPKLIFRWVFKLPSFFVTFSFAPQCV
ncbi:hypothetical protein SNEBB_004171 [Seison nebaliae]|nr:hypothetical protein SNEBB_004171 [Seison nebaliae]